MKDNLKDTWLNFLQTILIAIVVTVGTVAMAALIAVIYALPVMWLWNAIIPDITRNALTPMSVWQALGFTILMAILCKSSATTKRS